MSSFLEEFSQYSWQEASKLIYSRTREDVLFALNSKNLSLTNFAALLSPSAQEFLPQLRNISHQKTLARFGRTIQMYAPMYLTNLCHNVCTYCGFSMNNKIPRIVLADEQISLEADAIKKLGFEHILLVSGEASSVSTDYFKNALAQLREKFAHVSLEVQPLEVNDYVELRKSGLHSVLVYQETYHQAEYRKHHPKGKKSNFEYRLDTPDRLGQAEVHTIGIGVLLGLEDWRVDSFFLAIHLNYLRKRYWKTKYSLSFPRLRPAEGVIAPKVEVSDNNLLQLICAFRLFDENIELSLSTREAPEFRDDLVISGITSMSAGSKTEPGGYTAPKQELAQFEISDERSVAEVAESIRNKGFEPVWKNWDLSLS